MIVYFRSMFLFGFLTSPVLYQFVKDYMTLYVYMGESVPHSLSSYYIKIVISLLFSPVVYTCTIPQTVGVTAIHSSEELGSRSN
jgi:hypothetical protein